MLDLGTVAYREHEMRASLRYTLQHAAVGEQAVSWMIRALPEAQIVLRHTFLGANPVMKCWST